MKLLLDFLPLVFFFVVYKVAGMHPDDAAAFATHWLGSLTSGGVVGPKEAPVLLGTVVVIVATIAQFIWMHVQRRKIGLMFWISFIMIVVLGGLTVWYHNDTFIKWKPSVAFWLMGLVFWGSQTFFHRNLLREELGGELEMADKVWQRLNFAWVAYFGLMGLVNLWVVYSFSTDAWANFHTFGTTALSIVFIVGQGIYLSRHLEPVATDKPVAADKPAP
jgi:intracellular septation protein